MEKHDLAPILAKVYVTVRQQLEMTLELTKGIRAILETLTERDPSFAMAYAKALENVESGELGQQSAQGLAAIDRTIELIKLVSFSHLGGCRISLAAYFFLAT